MATSAISIRRIADTPEPHLIPRVMEADRDSKWAICDGTNSGRCREADGFIKKESAMSDGKPKSAPAPAAEPPKEAPKEEKKEEKKEAKKEEKK